MLTPDKNLIGFKSEAYQKKFEAATLTIIEENLSCCV